MSGTRVERVRMLLEPHELDALIVQSGANLRYMTGFTGSSGAAVVCAEGSSRFLTDFRYEEQARGEVDPAFEQEIVSGPLLDGLAGALPSGRAGFDELTTTVHQLEGLRELLGARVELVAAGSLVEGLRAVKDEHEIDRIGAAAALVDGIYEWLVGRGFAGRRERAVALELEHEMRLRGASGPSFDSIVASGPHGALPHAAPRDVTIDPGTLVTVDIGAMLDGYCSDCTRTFAIGEPSGEARDIYELVRAAQLAGLEAVAPGVTGQAVDATARDVIERAGYGERFGHGLGHGVGLEIHEAPRLSRHDSDEPLLAGNVVTIEPGVYLPGRLGVRIEDLVVVTSDGPRLLSHFTKDLLVID
ncbi:MAG: Xaa-Pro peptidase family protein [Solirubrobacteraceae bacterium]|jgi:Xaa-Pro aminopeptidase